MSKGSLQNITMNLEGSEKDKTSMSDEELMERFTIHGDREDFAEIYKRYFGLLYKYFVWTDRNEGKASDLAQNVLLKVYVAPHLYDSSRSFRVWLYSVAKNLWKNELRGISVTKKHLENIRALTYSEEDTSDLDTQRKRLEEVRASLDKLTELHREVIVLKYSNNLTIHEISKIMDCSEGTVKSRLYHALKNLRTLIQQKK